MRRTGLTSRHWKVDGAQRAARVSSPVGQPAAALRWHMTRGCPGTGAEPSVVECGPSSIRPGAARACSRRARPGRNCSSRGIAARGSPAQQVRRGAMCMKDTRSISTNQHRGVAGAGPASRCGELTDGPPARDAAWPTRQFRLC